MGVVSQKDKRTHGLLDQRRVSQSHGAPKTVSGLNGPFDFAQGRLCSAPASPGLLLSRSVRQSGSHAPASILGLAALGLTSWRLL